MEESAQNISVTPKPNPLTTVTPLSKALALILFIALPFLGFFLGMRYQEKVGVITEIRQASGNLVSSGAKPTVVINNDTGDWQSFSNKFLSLKYPATYQLTEDRENNGLRLDSPFPPYPPQIMIGIKVESVTPGETLSGYVEKTQASGSANSKYLKLKSQGELTLDGEKAMVVVWSNSVDDSSDEQTIIAIHKGYRFVIDQSSATGKLTREQEFSQILSTFKFLDPGQSSFINGNDTCIPVDTDNSLDLKQISSVPKITLCFDSLPKIGKNINLSLFVYPRIDTDENKGKISFFFPDGFEVSQGETESVLTFKRGQQIIKHLTLEATPSEAYKLRACAEFTFSDGFSSKCEMLGVHIINGNSEVKRLSAMEFINFK